MVLSKSLIFCKRFTLSMRIIYAVSCSVYLRRSLIEKGSFPLGWRRAVVGSSKNSFIEPPDFRLGLLGICPIVGLKMSITDFSDSLSSLLLNDPYLYIGGSCTPGYVKCLGMYAEFSN
jgi:hypothetical protein